MTRPDSAVLFWTTVLCTTILYFAGALPSQTRHVQKRQTTLDCTTTLSKDLYGLGVRLGIYFQWTSGWVSNNFIVDEVSGGLDANSIFLFALLISIVSTTANRTLTQVDAFIMIQLCAGTIWSVLSIWGYRTCVYRKEGLDAIRRFGGFGTHLRLMLAAGVSWYSIWFWTTGLKAEPQGLSPYGQGANPACVTVSLFGLPIAGPVKNVTLGIGIASTLYNLLLTAAAPIAAITRLRKMFIFLRSGDYSASTRLRYATGATQSQLHLISLTLGTINLIWILLMATLIELTANENKIYGVIGGRVNAATNGLLQPGQLLPMLIGAFSFVRCLFIAFELYRNPDGDIYPSLGRNKSRRVAREQARAQARAQTGLNVFTIFSGAHDANGQGGEESQRLTGVQDHESPHSHSNSHSQIQPQDQDQDQDQQLDPIIHLHSRLTRVQKVMVTWLPWLSLLFFWPWTETRATPPLPLPLPPSSLKPTDQYPVDSRLPISLRGRYSEYDVGGGADGDMEMEIVRMKTDKDRDMRMATRYNMISQGLIGGEPGQRPSRMV